MDCGPTAFEALDEAHLLGLRVVVIDHHQMGVHEPISVCLVNPHHPKDDSGCDQLCAACVTFLVLVRLYILLLDAGHFAGNIPPDMRKHTHLVASVAVSHDAH
jgi:Single-stranded DNA-specific exonuclease